MSSASGVNEVFPVPPKGTIRFVPEVFSPAARPAICAAVMRLVTVVADEFVVSHGILLVPARRHHNGQG